MESFIFDQTLGAVRSRTPFRLSTVALVNGDRFDVDHADALVFPNGVVIFGARGTPVVFDHQGVSQIESDLSATAPGGPREPGRKEGRHACRAAGAATGHGVARFHRAQSPLHWSSVLPPPTAIAIFRR
jgi:hypothetical protein